MAHKALKRSRSSDASNGILGDLETGPRAKRVLSSLAQKRQPMTLTELIRSRASEADAKDQPILAEKAAIHYSTSVPQRETSDQPAQVIALLGPSTFAYFITLLGLSRLGHTVLFLSTKLSDEAHSSMSRSTKASMLLVDNAYADMGEEVLEHMPNIRVFTLGALVNFEVVMPKLGDLKSQLDATRETHNIAYVIHSPGSTTLPRPNFVTHAAALGNSSSPVKLVGFVTLSLFHMWGLGCILRGITNRKRVYMYSAHLPLTTNHLCTTLKEHRDIQVLYTVPYALKLTAESKEGIRWLAGLETVLVDGSACPKPIGDKLIQAGVMLVTHFGSTETGQLMSSARPPEEILEWDWLRPSAALIPYSRTEPQVDQDVVYEMIVMDGWPSKVVSNGDDGSYATKDLYERHPDWPSQNAWRYYARKDDTIVLSNGDKANPLSLEGITKESDAVAETVVFGAQKPHLGMFLARSSPDLTDEDVIDALWPLVASMNKIAPPHARLSVDMIRVLPPASAATIRTTDKGSLIHAAFYRDFARDIDAIYEETERKGNLAFDMEGLRAWLLQHLRTVLQPARSDVLLEKTELFSIGVDSLQASQIRSLIVRHLDVGSETLGQNFVFDFPSITAMASELYRMRIGGAVPGKESDEERMQILIISYSAFDQHTAVANVDTGRECVVVTGATESPGAHVVAQLAGLERVASVVCLARGTSDGEAARRVRDSLSVRKLSVDLSKVKIAGDLTSIIHCAWSVNFNLGLESFEQDCIRGAKHLLNLCLKAHTSKPASFNFCSSISAVGRSPDLETPEELPQSLSHAQKMGYAQSKLVTEHICTNAARSTGMTVRILRIGQIVGDTTYGIWNAQEAIPMILQSATTIGALPALDEQCSWLPVDSVAECLREVLLSLHVVSGVYHVVNHRKFHWMQDLLPIRREAGLAFDNVDQREWLRRLRENPDPVRNPPYKLMDFFTAKCDRENPRERRTYLSDKLRGAHPSFAEAPVMDQAMVGLLLR